jgi:hypothetical protein
MFLSVLSSRVSSLKRTGRTGGALTSREVGRGRRKTGYCPYKNYKADLRRTFVSCLDIGHRPINEIRYSFYATFPMLLAYLLCAQMPSLLVRKSTRRGSVCMTGIHRPWWILCMMVDHGCDIWRSMRVVMSSVRRRRRRLYDMRWRVWRSIHIVMIPMIHHGRLRRLSTVGARRRIRWWPTRRCWSALVL